MEAFPVLTEGGDKAWREDRTCTRQGREHLVVGEQWRELCDGFIEAFDDLENGAQLFGKREGL